MVSLPASVELQISNINCNSALTRSEATNSHDVNWLIWDPANIRRYKTYEYLFCRTDNILSSWLLIWTLPPSLPPRLRITLTLCTVPALSRAETVAAPTCRPSDLSVETAELRLVRGEVRQRETNIILTVKTEDRPCWGGWQENDKRFSVRIQSNIQTIQRATFQLNKMKLEQNLVMTVEMTGIIIGVICHPASPYTLINLALFVMGNFWDHLLFLDVGWTIISPSLIALKLSPVSAYDINYVIPSAYHLSLPSNSDMPTLHTII